ncbi:MAG: hypothetical protein P4N59_01260 [Negativicutes bacterium]|nr:hypothetical protein [Negativicutes bacterium]
MPRTTCYDEFCAEYKTDLSSSYGWAIVGIIAAVVIAEALLNNSTLIGTEMLNNPYYPGF